MVDASDIDPASVPSPKPREHCAAVSCPQHQRQQGEQALFDKGNSDHANAESEDREDEEEDVFFDEDNDIDHGDKEEDDDKYASAPPPSTAPVHPPQPSPRSSDREGNLSPDRPVRVFADGIYDLFHFGHARSLEQAKKSFPNTYLLVGCCSDATTHKYKGKTVMTEGERYESLRHCKWVDEVIPDSPWVINQEFLDKHQIDFVAHDSLPYADTSGAGKDVYEYVKAAGKFKETQRTEGVSTSDLIMRILKDYNEYIMRNLAKGYSREDLGVSFVKEKQLRVNKGISTILQKVKQQQDKLNTEWVENADSWVTGFLEKFEEKCHVMVGV